MHEPMTCVGSFFDPRYKLEGRIILVLKTSLFLIFLTTSRYIFLRFYVFKQFSFVAHFLNLLLLHQIEDSKTSQMDAWEFLRLCGPQSRKLRLRLKSA